MVVYQNHPSAAAPAHLSHCHVKQFAQFWSKKVDLWFKMNLYQAVISETSLHTEEDFVCTWSELFVSETIQHFPDAHSSVAGSFFFIFVNLVKLANLSRSCTSKATHLPPSRRTAGLHTRARGSRPCTAPLCAEPCDSEQRLRRTCSRAGGAELEMSCGTNSM